jgi:glycosyltransferase involved in cell wall biosynthesis
MIDPRRVELRVLYDHQVFEEQNFGGISRYFMELFSGNSGFEAEIAVKFSDNLHLLSHPSFRDRIQPFQADVGDFLWGFSFRGKNRLYDLTAQILRRPKPGATNLENSLTSLTSGHHDVFHPTYFDPYFLESLGNQPFVLTVYDMIHEVFPEHIPLTDSTSPRKRILCERATRIVAISHSTKKDLIEHFRIDPEKIDVVYLANSLKGADPANPVGNPPSDRYILFTGNRGGYKNFFFFAQVIADILVQNGSLKLVCTGHPFTAEEKSFFEERSIAHLVEHRAVSDTELASLYAGAEMFVFPSLYEGFGMPTLEAFACGCPALLSDTPAMKEVADNAAIFFHPKSVSELRAAIYKVLEDDDLKRTLVDRGLQRVSGFSWQKTGLETAEVYRRVLGSKNRD